jgi:GT2 family glycosyltransferase
MKSEKILVILMNYFNEEEVVFFIENQLVPGRIPELDVLVVINGTDDRLKLENLTRAHRQVSVIDAGANRGYLPGAKFGLDHYMAEGNPMPRAVIISNSDLVISDKSFLNKLYETISHGGFDILGPDITSLLTGEHLNPYIPHRISRFKMKTIFFFSRNFLLYNFFLFISYLKHFTGHVFHVSGNYVRGKTLTYGIHGSFMVFARSFFEKGGTFNYPVKMFGEEIFLGEQALKHGMTVMYEPAMALVHHEHSSTGMFKNMRIVNDLHESYGFLLREYFR